MIKIDLASEYILHNVGDTSALMMASRLMLESAAIESAACGRQRRSLG